MKLWLGALANFLWNEWFTHIPNHAIRKGFLRLFNKKISKTSKILMHTRILCFWRVEIGERSIINQYCLIDSRIAKTLIGDDVDIAPYVKIWTSGHQINHKDHGLYSKNVIVGNHAWIASGATILPGVSIGMGAVVAAESLISKDVPEMQVWGGNPAKYLKMRENDLSYKLTYKVRLE